ncbi:hypothetical protein NHX12_001333 [Muraenolepis orangiensis]|uniref:Reverse transcriptase domain-containing protein n=1 Tax=Muraenolepis orangiensis TaxID=630683 RepID=A0A9Q0E094_9TELE|nr:hypothetical protein NHX12_001333 [Muraenolepis orangiensis]
MSGQFSTAELRAAIGNLRQGKSPGHDNIHPEFVTHQSETTSAWLCSFFSSCFQRSKLPKTWRRAAVIALLKPGKTAEDPKAYRPISLLCVPFKILERMILSRIEPVVDPQLPREQAGFRRGRSTVDQVTLLTQDIEDSFQAKEKVGVVLLDLTAAYDTVWHRGLHLKLLRTIPDRHMVKFIMEMLSNRSFILRTSDGQRSRLRRLRNGVPQGSVLSPLLFNIYIHDLPETTSRQYGYADDLAIMLRRTTWSAVEQGLNQDMSILAAYLRKWRLQLSTGKTVSAAYHLCNGEAKRELSVSVDNKRLEHQLAPKYLGVRLDRTLSYKRHLEEVRAKVTARVSLIRRLAGTTWGASARTLRISTQALVFSAAEYCAPVWSRSPHVKKVDPIINNALRIITGSLLKYDNPVLVSKKTDRKSWKAWPLKVSTQQPPLSGVTTREWEEEGQLWVQHVSTMPCTRTDMVNLQGQLDARLQRRQALETGICPVRRDLYSQYFDELIRQVTIHCAERGIQLLRVRDEIRMTVAAYQTLVESSYAFSLRKALQAQQGQADMENRISDLEREKQDLERQFLKRTSQQLKAQLEVTVSPKK